MNHHSYKHKHLFKPYPTNSLKQFLAHQSVQSSSDEIEDNFQMQLDIGDGRKQVLIINQNTNIEYEVNMFCKRHQLQEYVENLLLRSVKEQYQKDITERENIKQSDTLEALRQTYANTGAKQVLLDLSIQATQREAMEIETGLFGSNEKRIAWKRSQPQTIAKEKENKSIMNAVSKEICQKYGKKNILENKHKRSKEKLEALRREKQEKENADMSQCLFKPKINPISSKVDQKIHDNDLRQTKKVQRYQVLYENYQQIQNRKNKLKQTVQAENTFKPNINYISKKIVQGRRVLDQSGCPTSSHSHCRQHESVNRPKTGRKPQNRNKGGLPIGQYLYQQGRRHSKPQVITKNDIKALEHSDFLVSVLKEKKLKEIFYQLSQPPHEFIKPQDIPSQEYLYGSLKMMSPLLTQIQELGIDLNEKQFVEAGLTLINSLTPQQKHQLIFAKQKQTPNPSFNFTQNKVMLRQSSGDLYQRAIVKSRERAGKLQQSREAKAREQLKQCTFRPLIRR